MATVPATAKVVVIGAGIVGNSLVHHLAELGWTDIVQLDKGPLPNPGGSTGHASNFIFTVDHSREITDLTLDSVQAVQGDGRLHRVRRLRGGPHRGADGGAAPADVQRQGVGHRVRAGRRPSSSHEKVPFLDPDQIIGAFWTPGVGVVDSLRAGTIMREKALAKGVLTVVPNVEVEDLGVEDGRGSGVTKVVTDQGDIEAEYVVIACGVWSPKIGDMAGVNIALTPAVHQMISVGPCPQLAEREGEISFPIVRDMDALCYERQHGADMEVGSYAHRAILHEPEEIPSIDQAKLSPTEMPFTEDDFDPQLEQALELMPELLGAEGAEIRYAINGLLSLTADGSPILGESEVKGLWVAAAVWIKEGPGVGRAVAEWMTHGHSEIDISHSDIARFYPHETEREHVRARTSESFIKTYGIVHPAEQYESDRGVRWSPMAESQKALGATFYETVGWERPWWYESNADLLEKYGDAVMPREHEWDARWWSPIINAEHLAMRENAGVIDLTAFSIFDITGPGALASVQQTCVAQCDVAVGKVIYTPVLDAKGGFLSDLTVMRLGEDHFRVVTGGAHGRADLKWFTDHLVDGASLADVTEEISTVGLWGPRARDILSSLTGDDVSDGGFGFLTCARDRRQGRRQPGARLPHLLRRRARLGALRAVRPGRPALGRRPDRGQGPRRRSRRHRRLRHHRPLEKGYRAFGAELDAERTIVEAGMQRPKVKAADFVGKEAYLAQRDVRAGCRCCARSPSTTTPRRAA